MCRTPRNLSQSNELRTHEVVNVRVVNLDIRQCRRCRRFTLECVGNLVTRHTAVSVLIGEGVPLKVIQEILGHSVLSTTADVYGHLFPQAFTEAAEAMERALGTGS